MVAALVSNPAYSLAAGTASGAARGMPDRAQPWRGRVRRRGAAPLAGLLLGGLGPVALGVAGRVDVLHQERDRHVEPARDLLDGVERR